MLPPLAHSGHTEPGTSIPLLAAGGVALLIGAAARASGRMQPLAWVGLIAGVGLAILAFLLPRLGS